MSMELEVDGIVYDNFLTGKAEIRLDALCNSFTFTMSRTRESALPFSVGQDCKVRIDGETKVTGSIELMTINYDDSSHRIELSGRDNTSKLLDSSIDELPDLNSPISLKAIIEIVIDHIGAGLTVTDDSGIADFDESEDIVSPEPGDNAFDFIQALARKRQVLLTSDGDGNVVITRSSTNLNPDLKLQNKLDATDNNIKAGSASYDNTGRFNAYVISSQLNPVALITAGETDLASIVSQSGRTIDTNIPAGRQLVLTSELASGDDTDLNMALWEANVRKARGRLYTATVQAYNIDGTIWAVNELIEIQDDFCGISGNMLSNTVVFSLDETGGEVTELTFVEANSYTLTLEDPAFQELGEGFV